MKEYYEKPIIYLEKFNIVDIVTTSGNETTTKPPEEDLPDLDIGGGF